MQVVTQSIITNKGLDHIKTLEQFSFIGNHYHIYPNILDELEYYNKKTEYRGSSDQGSAITTFTKMNSKEIENIKFEKDLNKQIKFLEDKFNVKLQILK